MDEQMQLIEEENYSSYHIFVIRLKLKQMRNEYEVHEENQVDKKNQLNLATHCEYVALLLTISSHFGCGAVLHFVLSCLVLIPVRAECLWDEG